MTYENRLGWLFGLLLLATTGCGDCEGSIEEANAFLDDPANLECTTTEDCALRAVPFCAQGLKYSGCGMVTMNVTAGDSEEWASVRSGLDACDDDCPVCGAVKIPVCDEGLCR